MTKPARKTAAKLKRSKKANSPVTDVDSKRSTKSATVVAMLETR